jgi:hypothetical protein
VRFIIFSTTASFTADEIARCRAAQPSGGRRLILRSDRELEPYLVYEWAEKEFVINSTVISLEELADATHQLYSIPSPSRRILNREWRPGTALGRWPEC